MEDNELFFDFAAINPPPDALREFNVQTNMTIAASTAARPEPTLTSSLKAAATSSTEQPGSFSANTDLDARNFSNPTVSIFHQNQFGGSGGGPILRNKIWGFGWYGGFRKTLGSTILELVPTDAQLAGNLSGLQQIYNPFSTQQTGTDPQGNPIFTRAPFTNNQIPASLLNPTAIAVAKLIYPQPNYIGSGVNYLDSEPLKTNTNQYGVRIDAALGPNTNLFGRYTQDTGTAFFPPAFPLLHRSDRPLSPTSVRFDAYLRTQCSPRVASAVLADRDWHLGFFPPTSFLESRAVERLACPVRPASGAAWFQSFGCGQHSRNPARFLPGDPINNWEYSGTFTKVLSKHTIAAGASLVHTWVLDNCTYASATFNDLPRRTLKTHPAPVRAWRVTCSACRLPLPISVGMPPNSGCTVIIYGLFVDDVWKATPDLTVDLAVRYDYAAPLVDSYGRQGTLDYANSTPAQTIYLLDQSAQPAVNLSGSPATIRRVPGGCSSRTARIGRPALVSPTA